MTMDKVLRVVERAGLKMAARAVNDTYWYAGDGTLATHMDAATPVSHVNLLHEVCHHVAATAEERRLVEYGLPARPFPAVSEAYQRRVTRTLDKPTSHVRECAAQLVNWRLGTALGVGSVFSHAANGMPWDEAFKCLKTWPWQERGGEWLRQIGVDLDAEVARLLS